ncbi:MAG: hypothetical protein OEO83_06075 [Alphaproteobacteria bacterium]|nr:hypothetical protein [Alphaproteobacteria bacterium]
MTLAWRETELRHEFADDQGQCGAEPEPANWSARKTYAFVIGVASLLWGGIIYAAIEIL